MDPIVHTTKPDPKSLPGFWEPKVIPELDRSVSIKALPGMSINDALILENVFSDKDCQTLINFMNASDNFEEVGVQGMKDGKDHRIGSIRTSIWSPGIAEIIWNKINEHIPCVVGTNKTATDWWQHLQPVEVYSNTKVYVPVAISPLLRFMKYSTGGEHYAHYDAGFIYPNKHHRTLKSMVVYLTTNDNACTRFINDHQDNVDIWARKHEDWNRPTFEHEIIAKSECISGNVLIFNHRLCHDVQPYFGENDRVIIRGDIVYK